MQLTYNSTIIRSSSISLPDHRTVSSAIHGCVCRLKDLSLPDIPSSCRIHPPYFPKFAAIFSRSASVSTPLESPSANRDRSDPSRSKSASKPVSRAGLSAWFMYANKVHRLDRILKAEGAGLSAWFMYANKESG